MGSRILVTGATGTVGGALIARLLSDPRATGHTLLATARSEAQRRAFAAKGVECVVFDYRDPNTVRACMAGVDRLFLCTGYTVDMLVHARLALDAARDAGVRQVVHLGALGPRDSHLPHFVWHDYVEAYMERLGLPHTELRPRAFMQNVLATLRPGSLQLRHYHGDSPVGWIDVDDIASVAAEALLDPARHAGRTYPLCEDALDMEGVAAVLARESGLPYIAQSRSADQLLPALLKSGMEPVYAASLAAGTAAGAGGEGEDASTVHGTVLKVTGRAGTRWPEFARKNLERLRQGVPAAPQH
ncbi:MAG: NmrA family NAD(P)-binding protein [Burkholderiales bacterium]|nr:NmrA family NAD(P)-binding protein [Burkholderiales bacterium]